MPHDCGKDARSEDLRASTGAGRAWGVLAIALAVLLAASAAAGAPLRKGDAVKIVTSLNLVGASGAGTFTFRGPFADRGSARGAETLRGAGMRLVETLAGRKGTLRIQIGQRCTSSSGTWKILGGTGSYEGLSGGGHSVSPPVCKSKRATVHSTLTGTVNGYQPPDSPTPPPEPTPPPAPTPVALDGHYAGTTSNLTAITFDVSSGGRLVANLTTGQINESCNPPASLYGGGIARGSATVASDGSFSLSNPSYSAGTLDGLPATGHLSLQGRISGGTASGTLNQGVTFGAYTCDSGVVTWTATLQA